MKLYIVVLLALMITVLDASVANALEMRGAEEQLANN